MKEKRVATLILAVAIAIMFGVVGTSIPVFAEGNKRYTITFEKRYEDTYNIQSDNLGSRSAGEDGIAVYENVRVGVYNWSIPQYDASGTITVDDSNIKRIETTGGFDVFYITITKTSGDEEPPRPESYFTFNSGVKTITGYTGTSKDIVIPQTIDGVQVEKIAGNAFQSKNLESVVLPKGLTSVESGAFQNNPNLKEATFLGDAPTTFGTNVFASAHADFVISAIGSGFTYPIWNGYGIITHREDGLIFNPSTKTIIGYEGTEKRPIIPKVIGGISVEAIGDNAFYGKYLWGVTIPEGVMRIGKSAFQMNQISSIVLPKGLATIDDNAFQNAGISSVILSEGLVNIGTSAFQQNSLTSVKIPISTTEIGNSAFANNFNLKEATFLGDAPTTFGSNVFASANAGFVIKYEGSGFTYPTWKTYKTTPLKFNSDGFIFNTLTKAIIGYEGVNTSLQIPDVILGINVESIDSNAFENKELTSVKIPENIVKIQNSAFQNNPNLKEATFLGDAPTTFGSNVFASANAGFVIKYEGSGFTYPTWKTYKTMPLKFVEEDFIFIPETGTIQNYTGNSASVRVPSTIIDIPVENIGNNAFANNTTLESITIPEEVVRIGDGAFAGTTNLVEAIFEGDAPTLGINSFEEKENFIVKHYVEGFDSDGWEVFNKRFLGGIIYNGEAKIKGKVKPTIISYIIPLKIDLIIDPNAEDGVYFISPTLNISNAGNSPLSVIVDSFAYSEGHEFLDILPEELLELENQEWLNLNSANSQKYLALGIKANNEEGQWRTATDDVLYVKNATNIVKIGDIDPNSDVSLNFEMSHGVSFKSPIEFSYQIVFVFGLSD